MKIMKPVTTVRVSCRPRERPLHINFNNKLPKSNKAQNVLSSDTQDSCNMTAFIAFFQAMRQGIIARWGGVIRSETWNTTRQGIKSNSSARNTVENSAPRAMSTQAGAAAKKKTMEDWDYEVLQLITSWH